MKVIDSLSIPLFVDCGRKPTLHDLAKYQQEIGRRRNRFLMNMIHSGDITYNGCSVIKYNN